MEQGKKLTANNTGVEESGEKRKGTQAWSSPRKTGVSRRVKKKVRRPERERETGYQGEGRRNDEKRKGDLGVSF